MAEVGAVEGRDNPEDRATWEMKLPSEPVPQCPSSFRAQNVEKSRCMNIMCVKFASEEQKVTKNIHVQTVNLDGQEPSHLFVKHVKQNLQPQQPHLLQLLNHAQTLKCCTAHGP